MKEPRTLGPRMNTKKKLILYVSLAGGYLLAVMIAGLFMEPELYGVNYENKFLLPSLAHPFGTDFMGRDMFWRSVKGLSNSILIGLAASAVSSIIALIFGILSAAAGGKTDRVINWCVDCCMGLPHIVLLLLISYMMGGGGLGVSVAVAVTHWPELTRLVRAEALQVKNAQYVKAAYKMGRSPFQVAKEHIVPHVLPVYLVGLVLLFPHAIMHEAALTFLGFGFPAGVPAIGGILSEAMEHIVTGKWWLCLFPGLMLLIAVMLFDLIGDKLKMLLNPGSGNE
ncbi:MAG: ABC transporter permease [Firmicutes bacterium]|nr:ABC transporter permease [Bacillota bacterium]NBI61694.1 ABC transporter permease [Clostridiales bacterium]